MEDSLVATVSDVYLDKYQGRDRANIWLSNNSLINFYLVTEENLIAFQNEIPTLLGAVILKVLNKEEEQFFRLEYMPDSFQGIRQRFLEFSYEKVGD